jgi:hypothetical protein
LRLVISRRNPVEKLRSSTLELEGSMVRLAASAPRAAAADQDFYIIAPAFQQTICFRVAMLPSRLPNGTRKDRRSDCIFNFGIRTLIETALTRSSLLSYRLREFQGGSSTMHRFILMAGTFLVCSIGFAMAGVALRQAEENSRA